MSSSAATVSAPSELLLGHPLRQQLLGRRVAGQLALIPLERRPGRKHHLDRVGVPLLPPPACTDYRVVAVAVLVVHWHTRVDQQLCNLGPTLEACAGEEEGSRCSAVCKHVGNGQCMAADACMASDACTG